MYAAVGYVMGLNTARLVFLIESETKLEDEIVGTSDLSCLKVRELDEKRV